MRECQTCGHPMRDHELKRNGDRGECRARIGNGPTGASICRCHEYVTLRMKKKAGGPTHA